MAEIVFACCLAMDSMDEERRQAAMLLFNLDHRDLFVVQRYVDLGWVFINSNGYPEFTDKGMSLCIGHPRALSEWQRDLTKEGIEPNPGPVMTSKLVEEIEALSRNVNGSYAVWDKPDAMSPGQVPRLVDVPKERLKSKSILSQKKKQRASPNTKRLEGQSVVDALSTLPGGKEGETTPEPAKKAARQLGYVKLSDAVGGLIEGFDRRNLEVKWQQFELPRLFATEDWDPEQVGELFSLASFLRGKRFVEDGTIKIQLPTSLVYELMAFFAHMDHDTNFSTFKVGVVKCRNLSRDLALTPEQLYNVVTYAPVVAYLRSWKSQVFAASCVHGNYGERQLPIWIAWKRSVRYSKWVLRWGTLATVVIGILGTLVGVFPLLMLLLMVFIDALIVGTWLTGVSAWYASLWLLEKFRDWSVEDEYTHYLAKELRSWLQPTVQFWARETDCGYDVFGPDLAPLPISDRDPTAKVKFSPPNRPKDWFASSSRRLSAVGAYAAGYVPTFMVSNAHNEESALGKRVLAAKMDAPDSGKFINWVKGNADSLFGRATQVDPLPFEQWITGINSGASVRAKLKATKETLTGAGVESDSRLTPSQLKSWTTRESFVKVEAMTNRSPLGVEPKAARLIQGAKAEMTVLCGPWMTAFQGLVKKRWNKNFFVSFAPGLTAAEAGNKLDRKGVQWVEDDVSAYDASITWDLGMLEVWLARRFGAPIAVLELMEANLKTHGFTACGWAYSVLGTRKSGDTYTTVMNSILNALMHVYIYCESTGQHVDEAKKELDMLVSGDDNAMCYPEGVNIDWARHMRALGFKATPVVRPDPFTLEFCSCRLLPTSLGWAFVPKIGRALLKIPFSLRVRPGLKPGQIARGTALSMYAASEASPPLRAYLDWVLAKTAGEQAVAPDDEPWKMVGTGVGQPTSETWLCLKEQYGWDQSTQSEWEKELKTMELGRASQSRLFMMLVDRDVNADRQLWPSEEQLSNHNLRRWLYDIPMKNYRSDPDEDLTEEGVEPNPGPDRLLPKASTSDESSLAIFRSVLTALAMPVLAILVVTALGVAISAETRARSRVVVDTDLVHNLAAQVGAFEYSMYAQRLQTQALWESVQALNSTVSILMDRSRASNLAYGWERDLTKEGVEPNPGPPKGKPAKAKLAISVTMPAQKKKQAKASSAPNLSVKRATMNGVGVGPKQMREEQVFSASDFWQVIPSGTYAAGQVILFTPVSIAQMGDWLKTQSQLWESWKIDSMVMRFNSSVPSTQPGNIIMFFEPDPNVNWAGTSPGADSVKRAFTYKGKRDLSLWEHASCSHAGTPWLFTQPAGSDPRLFSAGSFVVMAVSSFTSANDLGALYMDWRVRFKNRSYNQSAITETAMVTSFTQPWNFGAPHPAMQLAFPDARGSNNQNNVRMDYIDMGVPIAYTYGDPPLKGVNTGHDYTGQLNGMSTLALPPGEYLISCTAQTAGGPAFPAITGVFMEPIVSKNSATVDVIDYSCGLVNISSISNNTMSADQGFEGSMIVKVHDDANDSGVGLDIAQSASFLTSPQSSATAQQQPSTARNPTNDWGIVDWLCNIDKLVGPGFLVGIGEFVTDLAMAALPALLFMRHNQNPRMTTMILRHRSGKELRNTIAGGFSPQEQQFLRQLRSNPNLMALLTQGSHTATAPRPPTQPGGRPAGTATPTASSQPTAESIGAATPSEPDSGVLVRRNAWFN